VAKGFPAFQGFGVIERAELIAQYDARQGCSFPNYVFDIAVFDMSKNFETFDWCLISDRRDRTLAIPETERHAPYSWRAWTVAGHQGLGRIKRRLTKLLTISTGDQRPDPGSADEHVLWWAIYDFYSGQNHRFELLAARAVERILSGCGGDFRLGWVTPPSSDGALTLLVDWISGADSPESNRWCSVRPIERIEGTTSGKDVARTVARLRRGWVGAYVTLGAFSSEFVAVWLGCVGPGVPFVLEPGPTGWRYAQSMTAPARAGHSDALGRDEETDAQVEQRN
jgi:hypothetical protein